MKRNFAGRLKRALGIVLSITLVLGCTAACNGKRNNAEKVYNVQLETPPEQTDKLVIYQPPDMDKTVAYALSIFKAKFPDVGEINFDIHE